MEEEMSTMETKKQEHSKETKQQVLQETQITQTTELIAQTNQEQTTQVLMITTLDPDNQDTETPLQVMHYNWHHIHDKWLNDIMKDKLGITEGLSRLELPAPRPQEQVRKIHPTPTQAFIIRYDVHIKVQESTDPLSEARLQFMELLTKIQEVDRHALVYPWLDADRRSREPAIDNLEAIPTMFSSMKNMCIRCPS